MTASIVKLFRPSAVLLDMDGTLTRPALDFDAIRSEMGITGMILESMRRMDNARRAKCQAILDRHESVAALQSELNDGCHDLLAYLKSNHIRTALITRNSAINVKTTLEKHGLHFELILTREQEPTKPAPDPIWRACKLLGVPHEKTWMVGDGSHDIEAGNAAGVPTVWISHRMKKSFDAEPTVTVECLHDVLGLLQST